MNTINLGVCSPTQIINLNIAVDDFSLLEIYNTNNELLNNEDLQWSYSMDNVIWSCWMSYSSAGNNLFELNTDYFIRAKVNAPISKIIYDGIETSDYTTSLAKCFDFDNIVENPNQYNPYVNSEYAVSLYRLLSETVNNVTGIPIYYFKLAPNVGSKDITFKEYTLMDIDSVKQIKLIIQDNMMPSSKPEFSEWGFDFSTDWETEISKTMFASAFGINAQPMEGDLVYIPMMKRMWMVNGAYEEKNEAFMWQATTFKVSLVKYQEKGSVDLGETQEFVDTLIKTKYDDLFGDSENRQSGQETVECPEHAALPLYPVFESDAVRKYVLMSEGYFDLNTKLISSPKYNKGIVIAENMYDWTGVVNECYISYQQPFCGEDGTVSFIITFGNKNCEGKLFNIGNIEINININKQKSELSVFDLSKIELEKNKTYLVYIRWNKKMNLLELSAIEYTYPSNIPLYNLQNYHYRLDINNTKTVVSKYDIELEQCEKKEVITYSFDGKITNIKVYDTYIDNVSELIQMYPTNQHLLINDTARKFVELPGSYTR